MSESCSVGSITILSILNSARGVYIFIYNRWTVNLSQVHSLTTDERSAKIADIHNKHLLRSLDHMREIIRPAVARALLNKSWISMDQYQAILNKPPPSRSGSVSVAFNDIDTDMTETTIPPPAISPPAQPSHPTGDVQPVEERL